MSNVVLNQNRPICRFNLRGMCRYGTRCWNVHESGGKLLEKLEKEHKVITSERNQATTSFGACSVSPKKLKEIALKKECASPKTEEVFGPSTSTVEEAVSLVRKLQSEEKTCGICFETILQKVEKTDQIFGILPNCNHCYCFTCIKKWRQSKEFELEVAKACPECRTASDFVYPSKFWVDGKEEKDLFIGGQKQRMKKMDCKYFRKGKGKCPFGNTCLYLHALPSGKVVDVGPPLPRRRRQVDLDNELLHQILFWLNDDDLVDENYLDDELDLSDPLIAMQYYDHGEIERYIAMDRLMREGDSDEDDDDDYDYIFL